MRFVAMLLSLIALCVPLSSQNVSSLAERAFLPYTACAPKSGPEIVEESPFAEGITERTVQTRKGPAQVAMAAGRRIMFAYPNEEFYANTKVELIPADRYAESKANLIENFDYLLASGDNVRNYALKPTLHGFAVSGLDRSRREGGVLGVYLLFDDATRTVITIYFLNQEPPKRFQTMADFAGLRDDFLQSYTGCIRAKLDSH